MKKFFKKVVDAVKGVFTKSTKLVKVIAKEIKCGIIIGLYGIKSLFENTKITDIKDKAAASCLLVKRLTGTMVAVGILVSIAASFGLSMLATLTVLIGFSYLAYQVGRYFTLVLNEDETCGFEKHMESMLEDTNTPVAEVTPEGIPA